MRGAGGLRMGGGLLGLLARTRERDVVAVVIIVVVVAAVVGPARASC